MISIEYVCGFANRLFQYSIANIIAKHHGLLLPASPISGIPHSYKEISGIMLNGDPEVIETPSDVDTVLRRKILTRPLYIRGLFQKSSLYLNDASDIITKWIKLDSGLQPSPFATRCDLVVHIRRGDYLLHNWGAPYSFYQEAIESSQFDRMCIVTDDQKDPFIGRFKKFKPIIVSSYYLNDFVLLTQARKIIMSPSTFSWWGAFLSSAEEVFFPIPKNGIWSAESSETVNLTLPSSYSQYRYIKCDDSLRLNTAERLYFEKKYLYLKLQNQGVPRYLMGHIHSALKFGRQLLR